MKIGTRKLKSWVVNVTNTPSSLVLQRTEQNLHFTQKDIFYIFSGLVLRNDKIQLFTQKQKVMMVAVHYSRRMNCVPCGAINVKSKLITGENSAERH